MARYAVILVHTTSHAIQVERVLKQANMRVKLIPTPRQLSSDCGSAVRIAAEDRDQCIQLLGDARVLIDRIELIED